MSHTAHSANTSSPPADLKPAPLRIPIRKSITSFDDKPTEAVRKYKQEPGDISTPPPSHEPQNQHPQSDDIRIPRRRHLGPKLGSLRSQFEILNAVNKADASISQYPTSSYEVRTSTSPRAAKSRQNLQRNLISPSPEEPASRASTEVSPFQTSTPAASVRKSMLPRSKQPITKIPNAIASYPPNGIRKSPYPRGLHKIDMDTDEQTSRSSTSYHTSHSTVSSIRRKPEHDPTPVADRRKVFEENSSNTPGAASAIPALRHARPFITSRGAPLHQLPKSRSFVNNSPSLQQSPAATIIFPQPRTETSPKQAVPRRQGTHRRPGEDSKLPTVSDIAHPQQRPSVADLRRSFEQFAQPAEPSRGSAQPNLQSKTSRYSIRQNQDTTPSRSSKLRVELLAERPVLPDGTSRLRPPIIGRGQIVDVRPRTKMTDQTSPTNSVETPATHGPSPSLPRSRWFDLQATRREKTRAVHEPVGLESLSRPANEKMSQESGNNENLEFSTDGLSGALLNKRMSGIVLTETPKIQRELPVTKGKGRSPLGFFKTPKVSSPGSRPSPNSGKVSHLRRLFERAPSQLPSPLSLMSFRSKSGPSPTELTGELKGDCPSPHWNKPGSPTSIYTVTRRRTIVPSLTTEISVNDFFCDFVGSPHHGGTPAPISPTETAVEMEFHRKRESPVKNRIQQFEHISRETLNAGVTTDYRGNGNDTGASLSKTKTRRKGKHYTVGGWKPIHQKGAAMWRKISNSFGRSSDNGKDCDSDHEHLNPTEGRDSSTYFDRSPSLAYDLEDYVHQPSPFNNSMHRVPHTSPQFVSSSQTTPSIQLGVIDSLNVLPKRTSNASYGCSSPDTPNPPRIVRKRLPLVARVSRSFRWPNGFGLDGHFPSKPVRDEEESQPSRSRTPGPSTPQGDPNALLKVMLKQSAAKRNRRRHDEKYQRRDIKLRSLARWKGKGRADTTTSDGETGKKQDKGKGKEKETQGQQEDETNKKTESGFVIFESKDVKLRHPKPRRPGQVRKLANMYRDKGSSGVSVNTKASSGVTLKDGKLSLRDKANSAFGRRNRKGSQTR